MGDGKGKSGRERNQAALPELYQQKTPRQHTGGSGVIRGGTVPTSTPAGWEGVVYSASTAAVLSNTCVSSG